MIEAMDISITKIGHSKLKDINLENIPFGRYFSDHMLEADYINAHPPARGGMDGDEPGLNDSVGQGEWMNIEIKPHQPLLLEPSLSALHYGQAIFEGMKAYRNEQGEAFIFRPYDNFH